MNLSVAATILKDNSNCHPIHTQRNKSCKDYKQYNPSKMRDSVMKWFFNEEKISFVKFAKSCEVPRSTLERYWKDSGLAKMKKEILDGKDKHYTYKEIVNKYDEYLHEKRSKSKEQLAEAQESTRYLSDDEEANLVHFCSLLACCGRGLTEDELLDCVNIIVHENVDRRDRLPATRKIIEGIKKRNPILNAYVQFAASLDPKRAEQANEDTRDAFMTKLQNYIVLLHEVGKFEEANYADIKPSQIYNMDEVAIDTTKHRGKVLVGKGKTSRVFQITPEGDNKMNCHITLALTSQADGKSNQC